MEDKEIKEYKNHKWKDCDYIDKWGECNCVDVFMYEKFKYMNTPRPKCSKIKDCYYKQLQQKIEGNKPFQDPYFKGLSYGAIAELAKKSIRITKENLEMDTLIENLCEPLECTRDELYSSAVNLRKQVDELRASLQGKTSWHCQCGGIYPDAEKLEQELIDLTGKNDDLQKQVDELANSFDLLDKAMEQITSEKQILVEGLEKISKTNHKGFDHFHTKGCECGACIAIQALQKLKD